MPSERGLRGMTSVSGSGTNPVECREIVVADGTQRGFTFTIIVAKTINSSFFFSFQNVSAARALKIRSRNQCYLLLPRKQGSSVPRPPLAVFVWMIAVAECGRVSLLLDAR